LQGQTGWDQTLMGWMDMYVTAAGSAMGMPGNGSKCLSNAGV